MPSTQQTDRRIALDHKVFDEILRRFNADTAEDVDAAVCDALRVCDRLRMTFFDVVRLIYGRNEQVTSLEENLRDALEDSARKDRERGALAEVVADLRRRYSALASENSRLRYGARFCRRCEWLRRVLSVIVGLFLCACSVRLFGVRGPRLWAVHAVLAFGPLALTLARWQWLLFSRKTNWKSIRDNELVRWWKGLP